MRMNIVNSQKVFICKNVGYTRREFKIKVFFFVGRLECLFISDLENLA
jgi:hypothetical protein